MNIKSVVEQAATKFAIHNRTLKAKRIEAIARASGAKSVLVVGTHPRMKNKPFENIIEKHMSEVADVFIPSGLLFDGIDGHEGHAPTWPNYVVADGTTLPFGDNAFDLVVSNAVIEHVGDPVSYTHLPSPRDKRQSRMPSSA